MKLRISTQVIQVSLNYFSPVDIYLPYMERIVCLWVDACIIVVLEKCPISLRLKSSKGKSVVTATFYYQPVSQFSVLFLLFVYHHHYYELWGLHACPSICVGYSNQKTTFGSWFFLPLWYPGIKLRSFTLCSNNFIHWDISLACELWCSWYVNIYDIYVLLLTSMMFS